MKKLSEDEKIDKIDFLFLDHAEGSYEQDVKVVMDELKLLGENSVIVADNCLRPGAPKYKEYVENHEGLRSRVLKALIMPGEFEVRLDAFQLRVYDEIDNIRMNSASVKSCQRSQAKRPKTRGVGSAWV